MGTGEFEYAVPPQRGDLHVGKRPDRGGTGNVSEDGQLAEERSWPQDRKPLRWLAPQHLDLPPSSENTSRPPHLPRAPRRRPARTSGHRAAGVSALSLVAGVLAMTEQRRRRVTLVARGCQLFFCLACCREPSLGLAAFSANDLLAAPSVSGAPRRHRIAAGGHRAILPHDRGIRWRRRSDKAIHVHPTTTVVSMACAGLRR